MNIFRRSSHRDTLAGDAKVLKYTFGVDTRSLVELQVLGLKLYGWDGGIKLFCGRIFKRHLSKELDGGSSWRDPLTALRQDCESMLHVSVRLSMLTSCTLRKMPDSMPTARWRLGRS